MMIPPITRYNTQRSIAFGFRPPNKQLDEASFELLQELRKLGLNHRDFQIGTGLDFIPLNVWEQAAFDTIVNSKLLTPTNDPNIYEFKGQKVECSGPGDDFEIN